MTPKEVLTQYNYETHINLDEFDFFSYKKHRDYYSVYKNGMWIGTLNPEGVVWQIITSKGEFAGIIMISPNVHPLLSPATYEERIVKGAKLLYSYSKNQNAEKQIKKECRKDTL